MGALGLDPQCGRAAAGQAQRSCATTARVQETGGRSRHQSQPTLLHASLCYVSAHLNTPCALSTLCFHCSAHGDKPTLPLLLAAYSHTHYAIWTKMQHTSLLQASVARLGLWFTGHAPGAGLESGEPFHPPSQHACSRPAPRSSGCCCCCSPRRARIGGAWHTVQAPAVLP